MNLIDAQNLAHALMRRHDLRSWTFAFNRAKRGMGLCRYREKRIELSVYFVTANGEAAVRDTILHEIAHALAGSKAGHGPAWRRQCRRVGATPQRCGEAVMPKGRWRAQCPGCGQHHHRHRRPMHGRKYHCRACGIQRGTLVWRPSGVVRMSQKAM